jgi:polyhydroxyalkanoate synthesis regulator phasin
MSHFYRQKSYTFNETDELLTKMKKEMSNFLTKEEAELILNRRYAMVDPPPYRMNEDVQVLHKELDDLRREIYFLRTQLNKIQNKFDIDEPTL